MQVYVQYADSSEEVVIAQFGCPQDPEVYPNQGVLEDTDRRYVAFIDSRPKSPL